MLRIFYIFIGNLYILMILIKLLNTYLINLYPYNYANVSTPTLKFDIRSINK